MLWIKHGLTFKLNLTKSYIDWMIYDQSINQMHGSVKIAWRSGLLLGPQKVCV